MQPKLKIPRIECAHMLFNAIKAEGKYGLHNRQRLMHKFLLQECVINTNTANPAIC